MTTVEQHLERVLALGEVLPSRALPVHACRGLVLAEPVTARLGVPRFDNSAMDGFAVRGCDLDGGGAATGRSGLPVWLDVLGDVPAGSVAPGPVGPGQAYRIMTGAPVPEGADLVVPVELTDQPGGSVPLPRRVQVRELPRRSHIRRAGEDVEPGAEVLPAGSSMTAASLAAASSVGWGELRVVPRPRVAVLATGSELVAPGSTPGPGQIPDSNSVMVAALVEQFGGELAALERAGDDPSGFPATLAGLARDADLVVTTGGVSVGAHDVLHSVPGLRFGHVDQSPGGPQGWGLVPGGSGQVPVLALPGNPVAAFVSFHLYLRPLLDRLAGQADRRRWVTVRAGREFGSRLGRRSIIPVQLDDGLALPALAGLGAGSHRIASLHRADALAVVADELSVVPEGGGLPALLV